MCMQRTERIMTNAFVTLLSTLYFWFLVTVSAVCCACCVPFLDVRAFRRACFRILAWPVSLNPFVAVTLKHPPGGVKIDPGRPLVIMANHKSYMDACLLAYCLGGERQLDAGLVSAVHSGRLLGVPLLGHVLRKLSWIPVDPPLSTAGRCTPITASARSMSTRCRMRCRQALEGGNALFVFPEGCMYPEGVLGEFRPYTFELAQELGAQILPITVEGTGSVLPVCGEGPTGVFCPCLRVAATTHPVQVSRDTDSLDHFMDRVRARIGCSSYVGGVPTTNILQQ